jgi:hypothetical protein
MRSRGDGSTLNLDFTGGSLDSRVVLTRSANTATYINSSGYVTAAVANEARFDYDPTTLAANGLLIEGQGINLSTYSYQLNNWTGNLISTVVQDADLAPDNTATSYKLLIPNTTNSAAHRIAKTVSGLSSSTQYTLSFFYKTKGYNFITCWDNTEGVIGGTVNASTGAVHSTMSGGGTFSSPISYGNGWYKISLTTTTTATQTNFSLQFQIYESMSGNFGVSYAGDGTKGVYIWGIQVELGNSASSYIPTLSSSVTRNPDLALMTSTNFSSWYTGGTTGTFFVDWYGGVRGITSTVRSVISTNDQTTKHLHMQQASAAGALRVGDRDTVVNYVTTANSLTSGARTKGAFSFAYPGTGTTSTVNLCLNGGTVATSSAIAFSVAPTWLVLGGTSTNGTSLTDTTTVLNGSIRQIKYYPTALTSAQLIAMTT